MNLERLLVRLRQIFLTFGSALAVVGALVMGLSLLVDKHPANLAEVRAEASDCSRGPDCNPVRFAVGRTSQPLELNSPTATREQPPRLPQNTAPSPAEQDTISLVDPLDREISTISDTLTIAEPNHLTSTTGISPSAVLTSTSLGLSPDLVAETSYTSAVQVHSRQETIDSDNGAEAATLSSAKKAITGPGSDSQCPASSSANFDLLPIAGPTTDHPDHLHGDFNLAQRGYAVVPESLELVSFDGAADPDAPQLSGLFQPNRTPAIRSVYRVNDWLWDAGRCDGRIHGCPGSLIDDWEVTLVGLAATPGEAITIPERNAQIFSGGYKVLVLYAGERQITLGYTRRDTVAAGYVVHILGVCVDPNLLALYRTQNDAGGWRSTGRLPALRNDQILGTALGGEIKVSIRDNGSFMDPRSSKDWWRGQ
jgi:hypothetical protein